MNKTCLFVVFDLNDYNYMKMPWRIVVEVLPKLSKIMPDFTFYVFTDSKPVYKLREVLERSGNVRVISISTPVLRYPYKGLMQTIALLKRRLNVETLIAFSGINSFVWIRMARALGFRTLVLMFLTPIYTWRELAAIAVRYVPKLLRYGTLLDLHDLLKLFYENTFAKLVLPASLKLGLVDGLKVHVVVMHDNAFRLFRKLKLEVHKASPKLIYVGRRRRCSYTEVKKELKIAYFGPLILARGYDIVVELSRKLSKDSLLDVTLFSRSRLTSNLLSRFSGSTLRVVEKFFESFEEIVMVAEEYDLILLPFRFILSDIPLVVLELACSGTLVVTTPYSHVAKSSPNMIVLDIDELEDANRIIKIAGLAGKLHGVNHYIISWEDFTNLLYGILRGEG